MAPQYPYPGDRYILVGTVTRSHGLGGEFKVKPMSLFMPYEPFAAFENYSRAALVAADGRMTELLDITRCRAQAKQIILKLDTIDSKSEADLIVGMGVLVLKKDLEAEQNDPAEQPHRLLGLQVFTTSGTGVGKIVDIGHTGAHPLLVINDGGEEYLVPMVDPIIAAVEDERVVIDAPAGLLEINRKDADSES